MIGETKKKELFFPHEQVRKYQDELVLSVDNAIKNGSNLVVHAPTGLGKTAATIAPAVAYAIANKKTVFFLTSRHTQHQIAIRTLKEIKEKHGIEVIGVDLIGKKWMCPVPGVELLSSSDFSDYCKNVREDDKCEYYHNTRLKTKLTPLAKDEYVKLKAILPEDCEKVIKACSDKKLCPYEMTLALSNESVVVIADYFHIFNKSIRDSFFSKTEKTLEDSIILVDEAHNLPNRIKDLASAKISNLVIKRAIAEAKKFALNHIIPSLVAVQDVINDFSSGMKKGEERLVKKDLFLEQINQFKDYDDIIAELELAAIQIRENQKNSYLGSIAHFLERWKEQDDGFVRIISLIELKNKEQLVSLSYRCLDPSIVAADVINKAHSTILMSGTLIPTGMYVKLLGIQNYQEQVLQSAFPKENRLTLIVKGLTTKYDQRSELQYKKLAEMCASIINSVPGNSVMFFPSYYMLAEINKYLSVLAKKTIFVEQSNMTKDEKAETLKGFKKYKETGACLFAVIGGSFGEGIDLPGDYLKCVCIIGLPLSTPDLETKSLIDYYDKKFGKGWEYGYIGPAFNKTLQAAGRCIRTETDRGVIVFLDERYTWTNYKKYFPQDWDLLVTPTPDVQINAFFEKK